MKNNENNVKNLNEEAKRHFEDGNSFYELERYMLMLFTIMAIRCITWANTRRQMIALIDQFIWIRMMLMFIVLKPMSYMN